MIKNNYDAVKTLSDATKRNKIHLSVLIAETALWASPKAHKYLLAEDGFGAFYPNTRRYRAGQGEKKGMMLGSVRLDDNAYANNAIKKAVGIPKEKLIGYEVCHIWPLSSYDTRYHTNIANLVLIPRPLAGLSDHDAGIIAALQYRARDLYDWWPKEAKTPRKPSYYPDCWNDPLPFTKQIENSLKRRRVAKQAIPTHICDEKQSKSGNQAISQRDYMRKLIQRYAPDKEKIIREYASAERRGKVNRTSNDWGLSPEDYARRLLSDAKQRGWDKD